MRTGTKTGRRGGGSATNSASSAAPHPATRTTTPPPSRAVQAMTLRRWCLCAAVVTTSRTGVSAGFWMHLPLCIQSGLSM